MGTLGLIFRHVNLHFEMLNTYLFVRILCRILHRNISTGRKKNPFLQPLVKSFFIKTMRLISHSFIHSPSGSALSVLLFLHLLPILCHCNSLTAEWHHSYSFWTPFLKKNHKQPGRTWLDYHKWWINKSPYLNVPFYVPGLMPILPPRVSRSVATGTGTLRY